MTQQEIFTQIQQMLASLFEIEPKEIKPESKLFEELELDSIDAIDLVVKLQKTIGKKIMPEDFKNVRTVQDVVDVVYKLVNNK
ncbi:MAG: acyl carrier protein [Succinivibrio dextrinosolvens]|uniref:Acyl carrier protein n=1 Tax=Succinivibrio dextrinosolvens TaxID=83771 RepID=A0A662ZAR5_9GAMM|nr:acyl carrier protein [Succinivibrio dextrinosolvens]MDY6416893.1 acyl carrier protein [Succinivibrio dextrinosolvens]MDY6420762.1 acyl carrier protein [Succinivibrio dextrinosolvens]MDY6471477.1 acyl carrier protein [Succinivibrio dextrinosolvens]SFK24900.1 acyl carrier protein [Succinivibrio dextrinosolvens]